jgi:hypothetical protein
LNFILFGIKVFPFFIANEDFLILVPPWMALLPSENDAKPSMWKVWGRRFSCFRRSNLLGEGAFY